MKLKVLFWNRDTGYHTCEGVDCEAFPGHHSGKVEVDLMVDGGLPWREGIERALVGQVIECEYIFPCKFLASGVHVQNAEHHARPERT